MPPQDLAQVQLDHPQNHEPLHAGQAWKSLARPPWAMNPCILGLRRNPLNPKISSFDRSISNMGLLLCLPQPGCLPPKGVPIQKLSREESIEMDPEVNPKIHRCSIAELVKAEMAVWQHNELLQLLKPPLCDIKNEVCQRVLWLLAPQELAKRIWHLLGLLETCVCQLLVFLLLPRPSYVDKLSFRIQLVSLSMHSSLLWSISLSCDALAEAAFHLWNLECVAAWLANRKCNPHAQRGKIRECPRNWSPGWWRSRSLNQILRGHSSVDSHPVIWLLGENIWKNWSKKLICHFYPPTNMGMAQITSTNLLIEVNFCCLRPWWHPWYILYN